MTEMLELSDKYFKAAIIKMLETNENNRKSKQRNGNSEQRQRRYKKESNGHFGTKNSFKKFIKTQQLDSTTEWRGERKKINKY